MTGDAHGAPMAPRLAAAWVARGLREAGHRALFAGGCVRDALLGHEAADYDVATDATPDQIRRVFPRAIGVGESFGVKNQSGVLEMNAHLLRVRCLPKDLPEVIVVDVTELKVGETIKAGEMKPIAGVEFLDTKGQPVVSCVEPVAEVVQEPDRHRRPRQA